MSVARFQVDNEPRMARYASTLQKFCAHYGFDIGALAEPDAATPQYTVHGAAPDGKINALRIIPWGRFGNFVFQVLHAIMLARKVGCSCVELTAVMGGPVERQRRIKNMIFSNPALAAPVLPALSGHFFKARAFPSVLQKISQDFVSETVRDYLKPVFKDIRRHKRRVGAKVAVAHFRAGDVFQHIPPHQFYVQPPVSFYIRAIEHLTKEHGVRSVLLVAEDKGNPALAGVEAELCRRGITFKIQSGSFEQDFGSLMGASHLVASFSTFVEAAAMLSDKLKTYAAFRDVESHGRLQQRERPLLDMLFYENGVECLLFEDAAGGYIAHSDWENTPEQIDLILNYPAANLRLVTVAAKPCARHWLKGRH